MLSQHFDGYSTETGQITHRNLEDIQKMSLETFGSKRAKRMFGQKAKNNYNADLVKDQLEATLAGEEILFSSFVHFKSNFYLQQNI